MRKPGRFLNLVLIICSLAAAPGCGGPSAEPPDGLLVFVLAGQSNMSGRGRLDRLPPVFPRYGRHLWLLGNDDRWRPAREPLDDPAGQVDNISVDFDAGVGPGLAFGQEMAHLDPERDIGLVPCARGGSNMDQWLRRGGSLTLYGSCLRRVGLAARKGRLAGVLWYQGESDTAEAAAVEAWPARFAALVARLRRDVGDPTLPVVFVQLAEPGPRLAQDPRAAHWRRLQELQARIDLPGVAMVSAMGLPVADDGLHLTTAGALELGKEMGAAMDKLLIRGGGKGGDGR